MAAGALLRSVASKMSRAGAAPTHHRSLVARGLHGGARSGPATSGASSFSGPQTDSKKVRSGGELSRVKIAAIETITMCAFFTVVGGVIVIYRWVNPTLDRMAANLEASNRLDMEIMDEIKRGHQRIREELGSRKS